MEYPTKEKNFSNSLEPKIFSKRDYNFYKNEFFRISHSYIWRNKDRFINSKYDNILYFYKHSLERDYKNEKEFDCELISTQFIYFGKFIIHKKYIYFKTVEDPRYKNEQKKKKIYFLNIFFLLKNIIIMKKQKIKNYFYLLKI